VAAVALTAVAYGGSTGVSYAETPSPTPTPMPPITALAMHATNHGPILVDDKGNTLYLFAADKSTASTCTGACAEAWPPVTTTGGKPTVGSGLTDSLVGTTKRSDGSTEVTYAGHPLYYFAGDKKAGQANGQNLNNFGAKWYVVAPNGTSVTAPSVTVTGTGSAQPTPTPTSGSNQPGY
jgi:predicted lipoprotein with Yx(FWY)xxD motif